MDSSLPHLAKYRLTIKKKRKILKVNSLVKSQCGAFYFRSPDMTIKIHFTEILGNRIRGAASAAPSGEEHNACV